MKHITTNTKYKNKTQQQNTDNTQHNNIIKQSRQTIQNIRKRIIITHNIYIYIIKTNVQHKQNTQQHNNDKT